MENKKKHKKLFAKTRASCKEYHTPVWSQAASNSQHLSLMLNSLNR